MKFDKNITELAIRVVESYGGNPPNTNDMLGLKLYERAVNYLIPQIPEVLVVSPPPKPIP